ISDWSVFTPSSMVRVSPPVSRLATIHQMLAAQTTIAAIAATGVQDGISNGRWVIGHLAGRSPHRPGRGGAGVRDCLRAYRAPSRGRIRGNPNEARGSHGRLACALAPTSPRS